MQSKFTCPHCNTTIAVSRDTVSSNVLSFDNPNIGKYMNPEKEVPDLIEPTIVNLRFYFCPTCEKHTFEIAGFGSNVYFKDTFRVYPTDLFKSFPDYIPQSILKDYQEASSIVKLSPKASATLSRRCLQGMIRDFWSISKPTLLQEIQAIEDKVDPNVKDVLHAIRQIGNIGAHPERDINLIVDIEPDEAEQLIMFIEYLFDEWYIKDFETNKMLSKIKKLNIDKQNLRKSQD